ncbi:hypothetical protein NDU88_003098 [Pleurodeles waltl]|uniref:Uncharacterized protein n=1 Tax=Pleurodeles waltl TaxID=8319 RepID=A0AAV7PAB1_PLEWA|nr:hypothetical protein NDU88_003098 [Pleurodeles waltl]
MSGKNGEAEALTKHTKVILAAIQESKTPLENQIATLVGEVGLLRDDQKKNKRPGQSHRRDGERDDPKGENTQATNGMRGRGPENRSR